MGAAFQTGRAASLEERYKALFRVSVTLMANRDPEELLRVLSSQLREVVDFYCLIVGVYDEQAERVCLRIFDETGAPITAPKLAAEDTMTWWVYQHQQPLMIPSLDQETGFPAVAALLKDLGIRSLCALPLTTGHRRLGGLALASKEVDAYNKEEVCFLKLVANQVALAIDDALNLETSQLAQAALHRKQEELQRERNRLQLLLDVTNQVVSNLELRDLLRAISASVRRVMQCDSVGVVLPDSDTRQLRVYALDFPESKGCIKEEHLIPIGKSPLAVSFQTGKPLVVNHSDATGDTAEIDPEEHCTIACEGIKSSCFLPLVSRDRTLGVLALASVGENVFNQDEVDFLSQVASQVAIAVENACAYRQIADLKDGLAQEKLYLEDEIRTELNFEQIVGESAALRRALQQVETVAPTDSTVLIYGETGTGKELIARAIHDRSSRRSGAFVKLNCAAIPTGLLESELFGHEKGAFTGAVAQRIGRFELANHGTIFLDEVGEIPLELQPKLLRVLQEREFERLGNSRTLHTDARLIAATNRDLAAMVEEHAFRADLFYRLNVFPVHVPPLRERPEDIPLLVRHFAQQFARRVNKTIDTIPSETMNALVRYHWPGNIRELQNVLERAVILSAGPVLKVVLGDLKLRPSAANSNHYDTLEETERKYIQSVLEDTNWVVSGPNGAAARLGLKRSTLQFRMRKLQLTRPGR